VEEDVDAALTNDATTVDLDLRSGIDLRSQLGDDATVDPDSPGGYQLLRGAARRNARVGEHLL
jgi:hypothetical protein